MKHFKRMLCVVFTLCMALAVAMFAACEPETPSENGGNGGNGGGTTTTKIDYTVTVTCDDTDVLAGITVKLLDDKGTDATEAKPLTDGKATFNLAPAAYTVKLLGDALSGYDYTEPTLTKDAPSATVALTAKTNPPQTMQYTVTVTCDDSDVLAGITVKLLDDKGTDATEAKPLTDGTATFDLAPAAYTVKLLGDALSGYDYTEPTLTKDAPSATVALTAKQPEKPDFTPFVGTWTDGEDGHKLVVTEDGTLSYYENDEDMNAEFVALEDGILKFTYEENLLGQITTYNYGAKVNGDKLDLLNLDSDNYVMTTLSKDGGQGGGDIAELPDWLDGVWSYGDGEMSVSVEFDGASVVMTMFGSVMPGEVTAYDADTLTVTVNITGYIYTFTYDADAETLTFYDEDSEMSFAMTKGTITPPPVDDVNLPDGLDGTWNGVDDGGDSDYSLVISGTHFVMNYFGSPVLDGQATAYDAATGNISLTTTTGDATLVYDASEGTLSYTWFGTLVVFTKGSSSGSADLPAELTGVWSGEDEYGDEYVLTFDGLDVVYYGMSGTVTGYDETDHVLTITVQTMFGGDMPMTFVYDPDEHTLYDEMNDITLTKQGEVAPVELPDEISGTWTGVDDTDMPYTLTFDGMNVTLIAGEGDDMGTFTGKVTAYDAETKTLTISMDMGGMIMPIEFTFDPVGLTLTCTDMFPVTLTKQA